MLISYTALHWVSPIGSWNVCFNQLHRVFLMTHFICVHEGKTDAAAGAHVNTDELLIFCSCEIWNPLAGCKPQHIYPPTCLSACWHAQKYTHTDKYIAARQGGITKDLLQLAPQHSPETMATSQGMVRACVVCLLAFKGLHCPSALHSLTYWAAPRWSHSTSFRSWIGSSLHGNNLLFLCGLLGSLKETRRA